MYFYSFPISVDYYAVKLSSGKYVYLKGVIITGYKFI